MKVFFQDFDPYTHRIEMSIMLEVESQQLTKEVVGKILATHMECTEEEALEGIHVELDVLAKWAVAYSEERTFFFHVMDHLV